MDVFVQNLPENVTAKQVHSFLLPWLDECGVSTFHVDKRREKPFATITIADTARGEAFVALYGVPEKAPRYVQASKRLRWNGNVVRCKKSFTTPSELSIQSLFYEAAQKKNRAVASLAIPGRQQYPGVTRMDVTQLQCGIWQYPNDELTFTECFKDTRKGQMMLGRREALITLFTSASERCLIRFSYKDCLHVNVGGPDRPTISFTLSVPPKFYSEIDDAALLATLLESTLHRSHKKRRLRQTRLCGIDKDHAKVAGVCFVYRLSCDPSMLRAAKSSLKSSFGNTCSISVDTPAEKPSQSLEEHFRRLSLALTDQHAYGQLPFTLLYQLFRLASNGILDPPLVQSLLPTVQQLLEDHGTETTVSAVHRLSRDVPVAGPETTAAQRSSLTLQQMLREYSADYQHSCNSPMNPYQIFKRHVHIKLIHKVVVTPTGVYLEGPAPELTNRVLRKYAESTDHFIRVAFVDEDGSNVRYDPRADQGQVYHERFKGILDRGISIAGRHFSFLGFSHSSLRSQTCWFMAPVFYRDSLQLAANVIASLGDFTDIRVPAKCAARIGQNFTDTNATIDLHSSYIGQLPMVQRNGRDFSDGVGTISEELLFEVWRVYGSRRLLKPTVLQVRFQGAKGMVSLDPRLTGNQLMLRENMRKFETASSWNLEICGAGFRPLPMFLNRSLIKVLEDLGTPAATFIDLQKSAVEKLRSATISTNALRTLFDESNISRSTRVSSLVQHLEQVGLDYRQDEFLYKVVKMAVIAKLRDMKYRARLPVPEGLTLYGIMDETGYLKEGEVYVVTEKPPEGGRQELIMDRVLVTRSPVMHPGDLQFVSAVGVPPDSPLKSLYNCVVFSQHGARDLPSQLSGGDLDGDMYNIIFDSQLYPARTEPAASYPRITAQELNRAVTNKDMSDFFVTFMESDLLGMIANVHLQLADQRPTGTSDPDCIKLAGMASTAVDFSKTGIPVDMMDCPKHNRLRPDFMSPSPRITVSSSGLLDIEAEHVDDDDDLTEVDAEYRPFRYYASQNVLGRLYRAIDEHQFLQSMQQERSSIMAGASTTPNAMLTLLNYMRRLATQYSVLYSHHRAIAVDIRASYEESLLDLLYFYAPTMHSSLSEHEAFVGTILGRSGGVQGKSLREQSKVMRERFEAVAEYAVMRIVKGDEKVQGVSDLDMLYGENLDRELEALPRAIACLTVGVEEKGLTDRLVGEMQSFTYLAAAVCLQELERYRITTFGSDVLPRI